MNVILIKGDINMNIGRTVKETREQIKAWRKEGYSIGLVPTMGYLHSGHESLIKKAAKENDKVVVSIFVNPTQFAPTEDFASYPRNMEGDSILCKTNGTELIFYPSVEEMYAEDACSFVDMYKVTKELCGRSRPDHFRGVCTVVAKLLNIVTPDKAYFGQKDAQQLAVIKRMVRDLNMGVEIIGCPIVRENDGLAMSSRNTYLNDDERKAALVLSKALFEGKALIEQGEKSAEKLISKMTEIIKGEALAKIDYIEIVDSLSIEKKDTIQGGVLVAVAVFIGKVRLIDNFMCEV